MKRLSLWALLAVVLTTVSVGSASAQTKPEFKLGFKALADQLPTDVVGQPLESEHYGANGDSLQQTTRGLMVWRKADNWTAFTNGWWTWINGPIDVQDRANEDRFDWERAEVVQPAVHPSATAVPAPTVAPTSMPTDARPFVMTPSESTVGQTVERRIEFQNTDNYWTVQITESSETRTFPYGVVQLPFPLTKTTLKPGESFVWTDAMTVADYGADFGTTLIWTSWVAFKWVSPDGRTSSPGTLKKIATWHRVRGY